MADRFDVLLGILLDKAAQKDVERGLTDIEKAIEGLDDAGLENLSRELYLIGGIAEGLESNLKAAREEAARLSQTSEQIGRIGRTLSVAGAAIIGGIALSANQYVSFVEKAGIQGDQTADRWVAASKRVQNAQLNLGQASAETLLPIYEKAAELAEKAAEFVQENPDLVKAALNTGVVVATLGAVGVAVSKGIKLYADFKYLAATAEYSLATARFERSVQEFLAGSLLGGAGGAAKYALNSAGRPYDTATGRFVSRAAYNESLKGGAAAGAGGAAAGGEGVLQSAALIAIGVVIAKAIVDAISQGLAQTDFGKKIDEAQRTAAEGGGGYPGINRYARETEKVDQAAGEAAQSASELSAGLRDFNQEATNAQATKSYIQYRQQEQQAEENYSRQRAQIVEQGAKQIAQIEKNYAESRTRIVESFAASSAQALSNFQFQQQQAAEQFAFSETNAVKEYNKRQGEQQEEFRKNEERSREDHLREMRKLEEEHGDRVRDLVASRDALGLVREKRDFERRKRDAEESYRTDRNRRREDFKKQQRDQEEEFQAQRARRRQEFEFRQQQAAEQFARQQELARAQFEERLKQLEDEHQEQLSQTRRQTSERLRELQLQFQQEQITRRNAFLDILRDLDANLLNERNIRTQYYAQMQKDLLSFLQSTAGQAGSNLPGYPTETHAAGGYGPGYVGAGEFVASRATTRRLEGMIGGRLTQQSVQNMSRSNTINLEFPGGLVTAKVASEMMDRKLSDLVGDLTKGLVR